MYTKERFALEKVFPLPKKVWSADLATGSAWASSSETIAATAATVILEHN